MKSKKRWILVFLILVLFAAVVYAMSKPNRVKSLESETIKTEESISSEVLSEEENDISSAPVVDFSEPQPQSHEYILLPESLEIPICAEHFSDDPDHQIRNYLAYSVCYREQYEQAEWSAYCLERSELEKNANRGDDFRADPEITTGSATPSDYRGSGYDRGHLAPAADFAFSEETMSESFYMTNMSPQAPSLNRGIWKNLEDAVRRWARKFGRVYVVAGPVLEKPNEEYKSIGNNNVTVPEFYYKVILAPFYENEDDESTPEDAKQIAAIGFLFPNEKCSGSYFDYAVTVDEIEVRTGLDFFSLLDDDVEDVVENQWDLSYWEY